MSPKKIHPKYYSSDEYKQILEEVGEQVAEIEADQAAEAEEKEKKVKTERNRLKRIFTADRCGQENMHFVLSLIDRAAFLRVEIEYIEKKLQKQGCMDFFVQGSQTMWREHPLSKIHVAHSKSYRDTIAKLEAYTKNIEKSEDTNPIVGLINKGNSVRAKYQK